jgi:capsular polysaccharide biosynthesis protein
MPPSDVARPRGLKQKAASRFRRHHTLVLATLAIGLVLGALVAVARPPTYRAESRLLVGSFEAPSAAIPGYVLASQTVAGDYARLAASNAILDPLAERLEMSRDEVGSMVEVTAIPESAVLRVTATSTSQDEARNVAEAMADTLKSEIEVLGVASSSDALLEQYQEAVRRLTTAQAEAEAARTALTQAGGNRESEAATNARQRVQTADLAVATAQLEVDGLSDRYRAEQETVSTSSQVRVLGGANVTETSALVGAALIVVVGAVLGAVVGLVLAGFRDRPVTDVRRAPSRATATVRAR